MKCEDCKFRQKQYETGPYEVRNPRWHCRLNIPTLNEMTGGGECIAGRPTLRARIKGIWDKQATEYEEHLASVIPFPLRGASREAIIEEFVLDVDTKIARGELTEQEARMRFPQYNVHKQL